MKKLIYEGEKKFHYIFFRCSFKAQKGKKIFSNGFCMRSVANHLQLKEIY